MESNGKTLADAGEYEFIKRIRKMMPEDGGEIVRSAGDDCLVTESFGDDLLLNTTDTFVEGVHFKRDYSIFALTGRRCMTASVSDIAAMSGIPVYTLVSLSLPPDILFEDAVNLFSGLQSAAEFYGCPVAGGETTSTNGPVTITVTVIGRVERDRVILRSGAGEGDLLYVTGCIGDAMAGLMAFDRNESGYQCLKDKFLSPEAHIMLSRSLSESYHITSMIDMSDGFATDISNICSESCCGADIYEDLLPISDEVRSITEKYEIDTTEFAITSGEDFALLFTSDDENISEKFQLMNHTVTRIGSIAERSHGIRLHCKNGDVKPVLAKGYEHFKS